MKLISLALFALLLTGCASVSPKYLNPRFSSAAPGSHAVSVERGKHLGIDSTPLIIFVDGEEVAHIGGGQTITLYIEDGRHIIGVASKATADNGPNSSIAVDVSAQSQPILRTNVAAWGWAGWKIEHVNK